MSEREKIILDTLIDAHKNHRIKTVTGVSEHTKSAQAITKEWQRNVSLDNLLVEAKVKGEILLADALNLLRRKQEIYAYVFKGKRYDIGDKCGWIKATVELSLQRDDLKDELGRMFKEMFTF